MRDLVLALAGVGVLSSGCVASPKETVLNLDTTDRKWTGARCVSARKAVARYDEQKLTRGVVGVVGNLIAPMVGTASSLALSATKDDDRARLNHRVRVACISDPLKGKRHARAGGSGLARR